MPRPAPDEHLDDLLLEWGYEATVRGLFCLRALVLSIERADKTLPIDPHAWENTMTAVEWMLAQHVAGTLHTEPPITPRHLDHARRVHSLGSVAICGGERAADLVALAETYLSSIAPGWRTAYAALPVCYPLPEDPPS